MRRIFPSIFVLLLLSGSVRAAPGPGSVSAGFSEEGVRVCLELMELEAPESGSSSQMELPPLRSPEEPQKETLTPPKSQDPGEKERRKALEKVAPVETPKRGALPAGTVAPGLEPLPMRPSGESHEPVGSALLPEEEEVEPAVLPFQEIPGQLKEMPAPDSGPLQLSVPTAAAPPERAQAPEIPLLGEVPVASGSRGSSEKGMALPLMAPGESSTAPRNADVDSRVLLQSDSPEKYLDHHEEIDADLIRIYRRFYRKP